MTMIYKILDAEVWSAAQAAGVFHGAGIDLTDGYIHFSTGTQVKRTAALYFAGKDNQVLLAVDDAVLGSALVYEPSRGGDLFPHLFAPLPLSAVQSVHVLKLDASGAHIFPALS